MNTDELDHSIMDLLSENGRQSNRKIGRTLGLSEGVIRKRLKRLQSAGAFKLSLVTDVQSVGLTSFAYVRLSVSPSTLQFVAQTIAEMKECGYVAITAGRYDIVAFIISSDRQSLCSLVDERIGVLRGVHQIDVQEPVNALKNRFDLVKLERN